MRWSACKQICCRTVQNCCHIAHEAPHTVYTSHAASHVEYHYITCAASRDPQPQRSGAKLLVLLLRRRALGASPAERTHASKEQPALARELAQVRGGGARLVNKPREVRIWVGEQRFRLVELDELARLEEHDRRRIHDCVQPVRDRQHGTLGEHLANRLLQHGVGVVVDGGGRLVEREYERVAQRRAREAEQLPLPDREILSSLGHLMREPLLETVDERRELHHLEHAQDLLVGVPVEGVQIVAHRIVEQHWVLWNDGEARAEAVELQRARVDAVDRDGTGAVAVESALRLDEPPERREEGRLAGARAANDAHLGLRSDAARDVAQRQRQLGPVAHAQLVHRDLARARPPARRRRGAARALGRYVIDVLDDALNAREGLLQLERHARAVLQVLRHLERRSDGDARQRNVDVQIELKRERRQQRRHEDDRRRHQVEVHRVVGSEQVLREVAPRILVDERDGSVLETTTRVKSADSGDAAERLGEVREDGRARDSLEALHVARRGRSVPVEEYVEQHDREHPDERPVQRERDEHRGRDDWEDAVEPLLQILQHSVVEELGVGREAVEDSAARRRLEEDGRRIEHRIEKLRMDVARGASAEGHHRIQRAAIDRNRRADGGAHVDRNVEAEVLRIVRLDPLGQPHVGESDEATVEEEQSNEQQQRRHPAGGHHIAHEDLALDATRLPILDLDELCADIRRLLVADGHLRPPTLEADARSLARAVLRSGLVGCVLSVRAAVAQRAEQGEVAS
mmetsp:Transcript_23334/g.53998  ORF Transcript_23334/g.53998 Transcript_23334/m.53998 type:complete len:747 (-) Transcript_23334:938-3178(-)